MQCLLLEAHRIGHGGSGRNVGLVNAGLWLPADGLRRVLGEREGGRLARALFDSPAAVFGLVDELGIDCEARHHGTLHLAHSAKGLAALRDRCAQLRAEGAPVSLLDATETAAQTGSKAFHGALLDARAGTIQPLAYVRGLARAAVAAGASIHEQTTARSVAHAGRTWSVEAVGAGTVARVTAPALLVATNAYASGMQRLPVHDFVVAGYSQFATEPLPPALLERVLPSQRGCWDTATVMTSLRRDAAGRVILGAIGEIGSAVGGAHRAWAARKLARLYPMLEGVAFEHAWSGRIAMTHDHVPRLVALGPRGLAILGYNGRGIGPGTVFGQRAADWLVDGDDAVLPMGPTRARPERLSGFRGGLLEAGAATVHWVAARHR